MISIPPLNLWYIVTTILHCYKKLFFAILNFSPKVSGWCKLAKAVILALPAKVMVTVERWPWLLWHLRMASPSSFHYFYSGTWLESAPTTTTLPWALQNEVVVGLLLLPGLKIPQMLSLSATYDPLCVCPSDALSLGLCSFTLHYSFFNCLLSWTEQFLRLLATFVLTVLMDQITETSFYYKAEQENRSCLAVAKSKKKKSVKYTLHVLFEIRWHEPMNKKVVL